MTTAAITTVTTTVEGVVTTYTTYCPTSAETQHTTKGPGATCNVTKTHQSVPGDDDADTKPDEEDKPGKGPVPTCRVTKTNDKGQAATETGHADGVTKTTDAEAVTVKTVTSCVEEVCHTTEVTEVITKKPGETTVSTVPKSTSEHALETVTTTKAIGGDETITEETVIPKPKAPEETSRETDTVITEQVTVTATTEEGTRDEGSDDYKTTVVEQVHETPEEHADTVTKEQMETEQEHATTINNEGAGTTETLEDQPSATVVVETPLSTVPSVTTYEGSSNSMKTSVFFVIFSSFLMLLI